MGSFRDGKFKRDFRLVPVPTPILIVRVVDHMITIMVRKLGDMLREKRKVRFDSKKKFQNIFLPYIYLVDWADTAAYVSSFSILIMIERVDGFNFSNLSKAKVRRRFLNLRLNQNI